MPSFVKMNSDEKNAINNSEWNLGEQSHIKVQLHDDIRRIQIPKEGFTYDNLVLVVQQIFSEKMSASDKVLLKYKDEDGDLVTIFDSSDFANAFQSSCHTLKLIILLNHQTQESDRDISKCDQDAVAYQVSAVRKELVCIRDRVLHLLDKLDTPQDTSKNNLSIESKSIPFQQQESIVDENADRFHLVTPPVTQIKTMEKDVGASLPHHDQIKLEMHSNSSINRREVAISGHFDQQAVVSPYPNEANNQQMLDKRGFQPLVTSTSYGLPLITVHPATDGPSTPELVNKYRQPSYSPRPLQYQSDSHQVKSSDQQALNDLMFADQSRVSLHMSRQTQMWTVPHWQQSEYNYTGYYPSNTVKPINPYRRSPQPPRYP